MLEVLQRASDSASSGAPSGWLPYLLLIFGGTVLALAAPAMSRWIKRVREDRRKKREERFDTEAKELRQLRADLTKACEDIAKLEESMRKVFQFIEGTRDPFTGRVTGGLINTLNEILKIVNPDHAGGNPT